jgi:uncharacterized protein YcgI (DUF1989 family)
MWKTGSFLLNNVFVKNHNELFQDTHQYFTKASPARKGDYIEFIADMDLLVAMSTCPQGKNLAVLVLLTVGKQNHKG